MQKVIVIGCPGSGKSTFSKALHKVANLPLFHLDMLYWNADQTTVEKAVFQERLSNVLQKETWIIDGNYSSTMELRMQACDTIIFLDYPPELCLEGIRQRKGKKRSDMPWIEPDKEDAEFLEFVKNFNTEIRPQILHLLNKFSDKTQFVFRDRKEANAFLKSQT